MRIHSPCSNGVAIACATKEIPLKSNNHFAFTKGRLAAVPVPSSGATYVFDQMTPGLAMRVTKGNARTYVLYRRMHGRPVRVTLGSFGATSIPDVRKAAQRVSGQVAAGVDVMAERKAARMKARTVGDAFDAWLSIAKYKKRSWEDDKRLWEIWIQGKSYRPRPNEQDDAPRRGAPKSFPSFAKRCLVDVRTGEIENITSQIGKTNSRTANKLRALLSTVWNHAIRRGEATANPVKFVERFPERSRERFLKESELESFMQAVAAEPQTWKDYFLIALLTGQRRENLSRMRWEEIDVDSGAWHIPAIKSKNGRAITVPLTDLAVGLLRRRREEITGDWVFPSYPGSKDGCVREPRAAWKRILKRAGIQDLRVHDLRRSVGSWLGASGTNSYTIARALGHQSVRSGEAYVRLGAESVRHALDTVQRSRPALSDAVTAVHKASIPTELESPSRQLRELENLL
jgi:integrase